MANYFEKDPSATLDYKFDWRAKTNTGTQDPEITDWLASSEVISAYVITATSGIVITGSYLTDSNTSVTVWISDGLLNNTYDVSCKITTSSSPINRVDERTIRIRIIDR